MDLPRAAENAERAEQGEHQTGNAAREHDFQSARTGLDLRVEETDWLDRARRESKCTKGRGRRI